MAACATVFVNHQAAAVVISEVMAANVSTLPDEDGAFPDWIELHNDSGAAVDLGGWFLTDDPGRLNRWAFPSTNLAADARLLVFASGKNRQIPGLPLHTSFQLSSDGEFLAFVQPDGTIASSLGPGLPKQRPDVSYGLVGSSGTNGFLAAPTPGLANETTTIDFVADTKFSHDRGFHETNFNLAITCATPGATIYYTTNGSPPTTNSLVYSAPIPIGGTTLVRARAENAGARPSNTDTHTYLFLRDILTQSTNGIAPSGWPAASVNNQVLDYGLDPDILSRLPGSATLSNDLRAIPTFSIVMNLDDLIDPATGIYVNASESGLAWERPASIELIHADPSNSGFQLDAGLRIRGNFSRDRNNPKHSFHLVCRDDYGQARLRYPLFGNDGASSFERFDLRTAQDDSYALSGSRSATYLADPFSRDTQLALGQPGERGGWFHLYLNGQYWGLYNSCERPDASFAASYFGGAPDDYDVLKAVPISPHGAMEIVDGDDSAWTRLWQAAKAGFANNASYYKVQGRNADGSVNPAFENLLDVTNLVDYALTIIYTGNEDGPIYLDLNTGTVNNYFAFRTRNNTGGFRFVSHDAELSLRDVNEDRSGTSSLGSSGPDVLNPHYLVTRLRANAEFKTFLADRVQKHFFNGGALTPDSAIARFSARTNELHQAITGESARWGDFFPSRVDAPITRSNWLNGVTELIQDFFPQRTGIVLQQLRDQGLFPSTVAPVFSLPAGEVPVGTSLVLSNPNPSGVVYFTLDGSDPRATGGGFRASTRSYSSPIILTSSRQVRARVKNGTAWSPMVEATFHPAQNFNGLRISEIMFNPTADGATSGDEFEFLELQNTGDTLLDLGGAYFNGITFAFTNGTRLAPGAFFVLARNPVLFAQRYLDVSIQGVYSGKLANNGERISLHAASGGEIFSVNYSDAPPWPAAADGSGFSLVPLGVSGNADLDNGLSWRASAVRGGSPGAEDPSPSIPAIVINEVLTHTDLPQLDAIELYNPTTNTVDLSGWYLTDDRSAPRKFRIPVGTTLLATNYLVFTEDDFNQGLDAFSLDSTGDDVYLFSGSSGGTNLTGYSHGAKLGAAANGVSFGRYMTMAGEERFLSQGSSSLGSQNSGHDGSFVFINEIQYHPAPGDDEFIELFNMAPFVFGDIDLFDASHPTNTWRINGIDFNFPPGTTLPAGGFALVVASDPAAFRIKYSVPPEVPVFGPFTGSLQDNGERLELQRPDAPNTNGFVPYITVDEVRYADSSPWPIAANGGGSSIQRVVPLGWPAYGGEPREWFASGCTPGRTNRTVLGPAIRGDGQPRSRSLSLGGSVLFLVSALGESLNYQWLFNGEVLPGQTNNQLILDNFTAEMFGRYQAVVSDISGSTTSAVATATEACHFALSENEALIPSAGGLAIVTVNTPPQSYCPWTATNIPSWISFQTEGVNGCTCTYTVEPNTSGVIRIATLTVAGQPFVVTQSPADSTRPKLQISSPAANVTFTNPAVMLTGTASDNVVVARVEYALDAAPFLPANGTTLWEAPITLKPGTNVVQVRAQDLNGNHSLTNTRRLFYSTRTPLTLATNGGVVRGATNGQRIEVGRNFQLTAVPRPGFVFSNWIVLSNLARAYVSSQPALTYRMASNLAITANFVTNPYAPVAGKFNGLFYETNEVRHGSSGFFTLTATERGTYSARLLSGGWKLSASGQIDLIGRATNSVPRKNTNALNVTWNVALDGSDTLSGSVSNGSWLAMLNGDRAVFTKTNPCTHAGKYTFLLPGLPGAVLVPGGTSYGTVSIDSNGVATLKGYLSDKTGAAQKISLSKNGEWPLYIPLYSGKGSLLSWIAFTNRVTDDFNGLLNWSKPSLATVKFYPLGFATNQNVAVGARYAAPVGTNKILRLTTGELTLNGGNLAANHANAFDLGLGGRVTNLEPSALTVTFTTASGLFKGSLTPTNAGARAIAFSGAVLQKGTNAAGYFLGTNQSGTVRLQVAP